MPSQIKTPPSWLIQNARLAAGQTGWLLVSGRKISSLSQEAPGDCLIEAAGGVVDAAGANLLPGLIDLHTHGGMGREVMDADPDGLAEISAFYASHGVSAFLATTWAAEPQAVSAVLDTVKAAQTRGLPGARLLGVHLEGPYLNPTRGGAQDPARITPADLAQAETWLSSGLVRLVTLAPEIEQNLALARRCVELGVRVSAGHTDASYEQMRAAQRAGINQVTHTFNAMSPFNHRAPRAAGAALELPGLFCEVIADLVHVHPAALRLLYRMRGADELILVSDSIRAAGLPDGRYPIGPGDPREIIVTDGAVRLQDGALAGSTLSLEKALLNLKAATNRPLSELWPAASRTPARALGLQKTGDLLPGWRADLTLLDDNGTALLTAVDGQVVVAAPGLSLRGF